MKGLPCECQFFIAAVVQPAQYIPRSTYRLVKDPRSRDGWVGGEDRSLFYNDAFEALAWLLGIGPQVLSRVDKRNQGGESGCPNDPPARKASPALPSQHDKTRNQQPHLRK